MRFKGEGWAMPYEIRLAGAIVFICAAVAIPAKAEENTQQLLQKCTAAPGAGDRWYCYGRVTAVFEMMGIVGIAAKQLDSMRPWQVCVDPTPSNGAVVQVFVNWANKHPEKWDLPDVVGIVAAMRGTWPCS